MPVVQAPNQTRKIRFGPFELDLQTLELFKGGMRLKLQGQPLKILAFLLGKPGELVTREELRQHLWPTDTFVDFEHSLNTDIKKLREALSDEADTPHYIETLRGRGYRFIGEVVPENVIPAAAPAVVPLPALIQAEPQVKHKRRSRWLRLSSLVVPGMLIALLVALVYVFKPPAAVTIVATRRLTRTPYKKASGMLSTIVTDGARIYFREYRDGKWGISEVSPMGGEVSTLPRDYSELPYIQDISPDLSELLIVDVAPFETCCRIWLVPLPAGPAMRLPNIPSFWAFFAPDGSGIFYSSNRDKDLYRADKDGGNPRHLVTLPDIRCPRPSPDGKRLRVTVFEAPQSTPAIWEVGTDRSNAHQLFTDQQMPTTCGVWSADARLYAFRRWDGSRWNLWARREGERRLKRGGNKPVQLTFGPLSYEASTFSRDGKTLFALGVDARGELTAYRQSSRESTLYLPGVSASYVTFSRDGAWVAYVSYPEGILWRSRIDGTERRQLTLPPIRAMLPRWSPDGKLIVFAETSGVSKIYVVPADGGSPMLLVAGAFMPNDPTWSPDGSSIAYGGCLKLEQCGEQSAVRIFDLKSLHSLTIPESEDFFSPRWSPDGKSLVALSGDDRSLWLFSFATNQWVKLAAADHSIGWPEWSHDSRYVYANRDDEVITRIDILTHHVEIALQVKDIPRTGWWGGWFGITPDDKILLLRNTGSEDLYAFDLENR